MRSFWDAARRPPGIQARFGARQPDDPTAVFVAPLLTNTGSFDGTTVYYFDGQKSIENRNGSNVMVQQFIYGRAGPGGGDPGDPGEPGCPADPTPILIRAADKGDAYIHTDANGNVVALTDLGASVLERYVYSPYGEVIVNQETSFGDRDGDGDVDATDKGTVGATCTGIVTGACRLLDLDFDGDYDSNDSTKFDALPLGLARHPGRTNTGTCQPYGHQGLWHDPELGQWFNVRRQFDPAKRRFLQCDPAGYRDYMSIYAYVKNNPIRLRDPIGAYVTGVMITPISINVRMDVAFWGYGVERRDLALQPPNWENSELQAWNEGNYRLYQNNKRCWPIHFDFSKSLYVRDLTVLIGGETVCCDLWDGEGFGGPCSESILDMYPRAVSAWIRPDPTGGRPCCGGGKADVGPGDTNRRIWVFDTWADIPHLHLISHEIGHIMIGSGHPDNAYPPGDGMMSDGANSMRNVRCRNIRDVLNRNHVTVPSLRGGGYTGQSASFQWKCCN